MLTQPVYVCTKKVNSCMYTIHDEGQLDFVAALLEADCSAVTAHAQKGGSRSASQGLGMEHHGRF